MTAAKKSSRRQAKPAASISDTHYRLEDLPRLFPVFSRSTWGEHVSKKRIASKKIGPAVIVTRAAVLAFLGGSREPA